MTRKKKTPSLIGATHNTFMPRTHSPSRKEHQQNCREFLFNYIHLWGESPENDVFFLQTCWFLSKLFAEKFQGCHPEMEANCPPLYKPPKKVLQKGAPKETSTSSNPNPLFFPLFSATYCCNGFKKKTNPRQRAALGKPTRNRNYHRPNDAQLCRRSGISCRKKKNGMHPEN